MSETFGTSWAVAHEAPLSMGLFRKKNIGLSCHFLLQGILPIEPSALSKVMWGGLSPGQTGVEVSILGSWVHVSAWKSTHRKDKPQGVSVTCESQAGDRLLFLPGPPKDRRESIEFIIFPQTCCALWILNVFLCISSSSTLSPVPLHSQGARPNPISLPFWKFLWLSQINQLFSPLGSYVRLYLHSKKWLQLD